MGNLVKNTLKVAVTVVGVWAIKEYELNKKVKNKWEELRKMQSLKRQTQAGGHTEE